MSEDLLKRIEDLEKRVASLEFDFLPHRRLGPQPKDLVPDPAEVENLIESIKKQAEIPPVDRTQRVMTDGSPETPDHREIDPRTGMQKGYIVLSAEERAKGFVRPVRRTYTHATCGSNTTMGIALAETYARDPKFYGGTFCCTCRAHFPLNEFVWAGTDEQVGA